MKSLKLVDDLRRAGFDETQAAAISQGVAAVREDAEAIEKKMTVAIENVRREVAALRGGFQIMQWAMGIIGATLIAIAIKLLFAE